jgi:hypothetical protein
VITVIELLFEGLCRFPTVIRLPFAACGSGKVRSTVIELLLNLPALSDLTVIRLL